MDREIKVSQEEIDELSAMSLPVYTILCPLYKEWKVVEQFVHAIKQLDYPPGKLEVLLLLEEDDTQTTTKVQEMPLPFYFNVLIVPHSLLKTKPKALNYGLQHAKGEYCVIYDAEDYRELAYFFGIEHAWRVFVSERVTHQSVEGQ